jgi:hypothetical protein
MTKQEIVKMLIKLIGMMIVGCASISLLRIGLWFIIPWTIGWIIYDLHYDL